MLFFSSLTIISQNNNKRYIIVKSTFEFLKQVDRYKANSFTKFLFSKSGFDVYLDNQELPEDLYYNKCDALYVDVKDKSNLFATKNYLEILDCEGSLLYRSKIGSSKLKDFERAYRESIRKAFSTIKNVDSIYNSSKLIVIKNKQETKKDDEKVTSTVIVPIEKPMILKEQRSSISEKTQKIEYPLLYAQKTDMGYQLVNTKPMVVFILLHSENPNRFIIKDKNGTLINKGDYWLAEFYNGDQIILEKYQVKF